MLNNEAVDVALLLDAHRYSVRESATISRNSSIFSSNKEKRSCCSHVANCAHVHLWTSQCPFRKRRNCRPTNCRWCVHSLKARTSPFIILEFVATKQTLQPPAILVFFSTKSPLSRRVFSTASRPSSYDKLIQGINFVRDFVQKKKKGKIRKLPAATRLTTTLKWKYESICESLRHTSTCKSVKLLSLRHREFLNGRNTLMNSTECWRECERNSGKREDSWQCRERDSSCCYYAVCVILFLELYAKNDGFEESRHNLTQFCSTNL